MPLTFDTYDILDGLKATVVGTTRFTELVRSVGVWFADEFGALPAEDKMNVLMFFRPRMRTYGFDVCDSDGVGPVGCDYCIPGPDGDVEPLCSGGGMYKDGSQWYADTIIEPRDEGGAYLRTTIRTWNRDTSRTDEHRVWVTHCPRCGRPL